MRQKILQYIEKWERQGYKDGIPDAAPICLENIGKAPSYRKICIAILKNDAALVTLGYARPKCDSYMAIKKIEIAARTKAISPIDIA